MHQRRIIAALGLFVVFQLRATQYSQGQCPTWTEIIGQPPAVTLTPSFAPAVTSDPVHGFIYKFGGQAGSEGLYRMTDSFLRYERDGWHEMPGNRPPRRANAAIAYDEARDRLVLFGGRVSEFNFNAFGDLWEWDGSTWQQIDATGPQPRFDHAMVYDAERRCVLLYGGASSGGTEVLDDFWSWNGTEWQELPATPGRRTDHAMAFNTRDRRVYLHGGWSNVAQRDLWAWDGQQWSLVSNTGPVRTAHVMEYDPHRGALLITGGYDNFNTIYGRAQTYDGQWRLLFTLHPPRFDLGIGYHEPTQSVVIIGGATSLNDNSAARESFELRSAPFHISSPVDRAVPAGVTTEFCVSIDPPSNVAYQWRRNGVAIANDGRITGATTGCLSIANVTVTDTGEYDVRISSSCEPAYSLPARLTILTGADLNCDGSVNNFDIDPFVLALTDAAGYAVQFPDCNAALADVNGDGAVNNFDIDPFVACLVNGGCP
jgi:hypothetical protein